jgi:alpha,alpha-trehalose phosphorylase
VSLTQRSVAAIVYEVEPLDCEVRVVAQSELVANEELPQSGGDPRTAKAPRSPLESLEDAAEGSRLRLLQCTRRSGLRVAAESAMR